MDTNLSLSKKLAKDLLSVVCKNLGNRNVSFLSSPNDLYSAANEFYKLQHVAIISGFYIPSSSAAETDGPGGCVAIAKAFYRQNRKVEIWTDELCLEILRAAAKSVGIPQDLVLKAPDDLVQTNVDGLIFVERLGRASDGKYYNFRKIDISAWTPPIDSLAIQAKDLNIPTLGIGDGGNEVGMGNFYDKLSVIIPEYKKCLCTVKTKYALTADVSNWGAYALAAMLSSFWKNWHGFNIEDEINCLKVIIECGAVDGISNQPILSVDGFDLSINTKIVSLLKKIWFEDMNFNQVTDF